MAETNETKKQTDDEGRPDGRVATTLYIRPDVLAQAQAIARLNHQPGFMFIEAAVQKAIEAHARSSKRKKLRLDE